MSEDRSDGGRRERADGQDRIRFVPDATGTLIDDDFVVFCSGSRDRDLDVRSE